ncbi:unnamed protein product [Somion occarium]|uniref:Uncharacterized protein n=1 Tax=Somion occarium TaxID=3059160 RepID=A0ABP1DVC3_9APHY
MARKELETRMVTKFRTTESHFHVAAAVLQWVPLNVTHRNCCADGFACCFHCFQDITYVAGRYIPQQRPPVTAEDGQDPAARSSETARICCDLLGLTFRRPRDSHFVHYRLPSQTSHSLVL